LEHLAPGEEAEACYREEALAIARRQKARSLELRAAMSLARLRRNQGRSQEARNLLARVYGWFTEGRHPPDLQEAKGLLERFPIMLHRSLRRRNSLRIPGA